MAIKGIQIPILTSFNGKGANDAIHKLGALDTAANSLGKTLRRYLGAAAIEEFARRSVNAFAADQKAAALLQNTVENLGLALKPSTLANYIQGLQDATGILDDQLRPAFSNIILATKDFAKAQDVMQTALDVSAGTGKDLQSVSIALQKAYLGNTTALGRLGAGISKADLASKDFYLIQQKLNTNFRGDAATAADSYQGKIDKLKATFNDVQEIVGKGLIDSFTNLAQNANVTNFAATMRGVAQATSDAVQGVSVLLSRIEKLTGGTSFWKDFLNIATEYSGLRLLINLGKKDREQKTASADLAKTTTKTLAAQVPIQNKLTDSQIKAAKAAQDKAKADKASAVLSQSAKVLDVQQAQIIAALMSAQDEDTKKRLELQQALLNGNADAAGKLSQQILSAQISALEASKLDPFNKFASGANDAITAIQSLRHELGLLGSAQVAVGLSGITAAGTTYSGGTMLASGAIAATDSLGFGVLAPAANAPTIVNNYNIGGSVVSERALSDVVASNSASGITQNITRLNYNFGQ
jgi:hypothetical protein